MLKPKCGTNRQIAIWYMTSLCLFHACWFRMFVPANNFVYFEMQFMIAIQTINKTQTTTEDVDSESFLCQSTYPSRSGSFFSDDHIQCCCFSNSIGPQQTKHLARHHHEVVIFHSNFNASILLLFATAFLGLTQKLLSQSLHHQHWFLVRCQNV